MDHFDKKSRDEIYKKSESKKSVTSQTKTEVLSKRFMNTSEQTVQVAMDSPSNLSFVFDPKSQQNLFANLD